MAKKCIHDLEEAWCADCTGRPTAINNRIAWAGDVMMVIPADPAPPVPLDEISIRSRMSRAKVNAAIAYLRETYPDLPLVSNSRGIRFTMNEEEVNKFRHSRFLAAHTIIRRTFRGAVVPYLKQSGASKATVRQFTRQMDRLLEDIRSEE